MEERKRCVCGHYHCPVCYNQMEGLVCLICGYVDVEKELTERGEQMFNESGVADFEMRLCRERGGCD
jgi:hypothetical protein